MTRNLQNGPQKPPKWRPKPSKSEPKSGQEGARTTKKSKNNIDPTKRGAASHSAPPFWRKMWPTWPQLGSQDGAKMEKKSMQKSIKNLMHLGIDFWKDFDGFGGENGSKLAPKNDQKSKPPLKRKNQLNTSRLVFSWLSGFQVGSKNRLKIDQKSRSTWEGILASILERFLWILGAS